MKRGEITLKILEFLEETAGDFSDVFTAYFNAGYGASLGKLEYLKNKAYEKRMKRRVKRDEELAIRRKCAKILYSLKRDGLIKKERGLFKTTKKGKREKERLREKLLKSLPIINYDKNKSDKIVLVAFDVPENQRQKRNWLRAVLKYLDYKMIQKSVWLGSTLIPEEFIKDLRNVGLIDAVEIVVINKKGTLSKNES